MKIRKLAYSAIVIVVLGYILIVAQSIFIPLLFSLFFTLMLSPVCRFLEKKGVGDTWSIVFTLLGINVLILGVITLLGSGLVNVASNASDINSKLQSATNNLFSLGNKYFGISKNEGIVWLSENVGSAIGTPISMIGSGLSSSTTLLANSLLTLIFTFLLLLYRKPFKSFLLLQFSKGYKEEGNEAIHSIQNVVQEYLYGTLTVMLILGVFNSIGLWLIGLEYAFFWGFMAAVLAIIPYVGTALGGMLPFLYSLATTTNTWEPFAILALYFSVQQLEGNFITPKIVGDSVDINPFFAIIALLVGNMIWGVAGIVLFLPLFAILRIIFLHVEALKPLAIIMGSEVYESTKKLKALDGEEHRISHLFK